MQRHRNAGHSACHAARHRDHRGVRIRFGVDEIRRQRPDARARSAARRVRARAGRASCVRRKET